MLNSARRTSSNACKACARLVASTSSSSPSASSSSSIRFNTTAARSRTRSITTTPPLKRYNASFAQVGEKIKLDQDQLEEVELEEEKGNLIEQIPPPSLEHSVQDTTTTRLDSSQEEAEAASEKALGDLFKAFPNSSTSTSTSTPSSSTSSSNSSSSPYKRSPIYDDQEQVELSTTSTTTSLTLDELISSSSSSSSSSSRNSPSSSTTELEGGPTLSDLYEFTPKRKFTIPSASSPDSHRTIYFKIWETSFKKISKAFSKRQLFNFCTSPPPYGLELDLEGSKELQSKLRTGTKGRKPKWWKPKKIEQMSKTELIQTILVGHFGMVDPDTVPKKIDKQRDKIVNKVIELDSKTLFLLLSPNCPVVPRIANHLEVKVSFSRHPISQNLSLILTGTENGVLSAKSEIESLEEITEKEVIRLPKKTTSLRPQVYQTVSKLAKTYLEPLERDDKSFVASAMESKNLIRLKRYLNSVFAIDQIRQSISLFISLPTSSPHLKYFQSPYQPLNPSQTPAPLSSLSGTTSVFSRLRKVNSNSLLLTNHQQGGERDSNTESDNELELNKWSEKMRLEKSSRLNIRNPFDSSCSSSNKEVSIFQALLNPFNLHHKDSKGVAVEGEEVGEDKFELRAELGHLIFPLYQSESGVNNQFEPLMKGKTSWEQCLDWLKSNLGMGKNQTVWIPSAPKGLLESTGVTTPLLETSSSSTLSSSFQQSPFSSLFSDYTPPSTDTLSKRLESLKKFPRFESRNFRRLVYLPMQLPPPPTATNSTTTTAIDKQFDSSPPIRLEITLTANTELGGQGREMLVEAKMIRESKVDVFLPSFQNDLRLKLRQTRLVREDELGLLKDGSFKLVEGSSLFETLSQSPSTSPFELTFSPSTSSSSSSQTTTFFLHSTSLLRQTKITPPLSPTDPETLESRFPILQETGIDFLPEQGTKSKTFEFLLTNGKEVGKEELRYGLISEEGEGLGEGEGKKGWEWKRILEELEKKCR